MSPFPVRFLSLVLLALFASCERPVNQRDPDSMQLLLVRPENRSGVYLNEPLVFDFSHEVDRSSVTRRSLRIELADGTPARGEIRVDGRRVVFEPAAVLSPGLTDGGYLPGQRYTVTLLGFPALDSLRGVGGEPLQRTKRFPFTTVRDVDWPRENFVFADDSPERCAPLFPLRASIAPDEAILLACEEPLDPSTLFAEDFDLRGSDREPIPMSVRLIHNSATEPLLEEWASPGKRPVAIVELQPLSSLEEAARRNIDDEIDPPTGGSRRGRANLALRVASRLRLADFSGNATPVLSKSAIGIFIEEERPSDKEFREHFTDKKRLKPIPIVGVDGTALWDGTGQVEVRYPRAAGSGLDGDLRYGGPREPASESRSDLNSVSFTVGAQGLELTSEPGLCVVRSQGRMVIRGPLRRTTQVPVQPMHAWSREARAAGDPKPRLTDWLEEARRAGENWTVLVAGGDLVVDGEIAVDTPLLLVAGGMIRISGNVHAGRMEGASNEEFFLLGVGGGGANRWRILDLEIDPPQHNRLVQPISFAVLSKQIPQDNSPIEWLEADEEKHSPAGRRGGTLDVWYVQGVPPLSFDPEQEVLLTDPRLLNSPGPVHFFVRIDIPAAPESNDRGLAPWSPPFLDAIILKAK